MSKEYWLKDVEELFPKIYKRNSYGAIHVIEYSAYKDLGRKLQISREALNKIIIGLSEKGPRIIAAEALKEIE